MAKKRFIIGVFVFLFTLNIISALGIMPAIKEYNFEPGFETTINYQILTDTDRDLEIIFQGELAEYMTTSKDTLSSKDKGFSVTLKLPENLETPGKNRGYVFVKEKVDEELGGFIVVAVGVRAVIDVYVPYPGQFLEIELGGRDVNVGEPLDFNLNVFSRGDQPVTMNPKINIYDSKGSKVETLFFSERIIGGQESLLLKKTLDTTKYNPGNYKAVAEINYGGLAKSEVGFKIGDLNVKLLNYTNKVPIGKLQRFDLVIESGWNNNIDGVSAKISILNDSNKLNEFETSTTFLIPWEKKTLTGYFDTSNFSEGIYDANVTLRYYGGQQGKANSNIVKVEFVKIRALKIWYIVGGAGLLIIIVLVLIKIFKKNGKNKKRKKK